MTFFEPIVARGLALLVWFLLLAVAYLLLFILIFAVFVSRMTNYGIANVAYFFAVVFLPYLARDILGLSYLFAPGRSSPVLALLVLVALLVWFFDRLGDAVGVFLGQGGGGGRLVDLRKVFLVVLLGGLASVVAPGVFLVNVHIQNRVSYAVTRAMDATGPTLVEAFSDVPFVNDLMDWMRSVCEEASCPSPEPVDVDGVYCTSTPEGRVPVGCDVRMVDYAAYYLGLPADDPANWEVVFELHRFTMEHALAVASMEEFAELLALWGTFFLRLLFGLGLSLASLVATMTSFFLMLADLYIPISFLLTLMLYPFSFMNVYMEGVLRDTLRILMFRILYGVFTVLFLKIGYLIGGFVGLLFMGFLLEGIFLVFTLNLVRGIWMGMGSLFAAAGVALGSMLQMVAGALQVVGGGLLTGLGAVVGGTAALLGSQRLGGVGKTLSMAGGYMMGRTGVGQTVTRGLALRQTLRRQQMGLGEMVRALSPSSAWLAGAYWRSAGGYGLMGMFFAAERLSRMAQEDLMGRAIEGDPEAFRMYQDIMHRQRRAVSTMRSLHQMHTPTAQGALARASRAVVTRQDQVVGAARLGLTRAGVWAGGRSPHKQGRRVVSLDPGVAADWLRVLPRLRQPAQQSVLSSLHAMGLRAEDLQPLLQEQDMEGRPLAALVLDAVGQVETEILEEVRRTGRPITAFYMGGRQSVYARMLREHLLARAPQVFEARPELLDRAVQLGVQAASPMVEVSLPQLLRWTQEAYQRGEDPVEYVSRHYGLSEVYLREAGLGQLLHMYYSTLQSRELEPHERVLRMIAEGNLETNARAMARIRRQMAEAWRDHPALQALLRGDLSDRVLRETESMLQRLTSDPAVRAFLEHVRDQARVHGLAPRLAYAEVVRALASLPASVTLKAEPDSRLLQQAHFGRLLLQPHRIELQLMDRSVSHEIVPVPFTLPETDDPRLRGLYDRLMLAFALQGHLELPLLEQALMVQQEKDEGLLQELTRRLDTLIHEALSHTAARQGLPELMAEVHGHAENYDQVFVARWKQALLGTVKEWSSLVQAKAGAMSLEEFVAFVRQLQNAETFGEEGVEEEGEA